MSSTPHQIAQCITPAAALQCSGVRLQFTALGADAVVQLRDAARGLPGGAILAERRITPDQFAAAAGAPIDATWPPTLLTAGVEYAIVVQAGDTATALRVAQIGAYDATTNRWVTAQPDQIGSFSTAAADGAWVGHADTHLTFDLLQAEYTQAAQTFDIGSVAVTGATDLAINAAALKPAAGAGCDFALQLDDGSIYPLADQQRIELPAAYTGNVQVRATLRVADRLSAVLEPAVSLVHGALSPSADYVGPMLDFNGGTELRVIYDAQLPAGSGVQVHLQAEGSGTWTLVPYQSSVGGTVGAVEQTHALTGISATRARLRLTLTGAVRARPLVTNLRAVVL